MQDKYMSENLALLSNVSHFLTNVDWLVQVGSNQLL